MVATRIIWALGLTLLFAAPAHADYLAYAVGKGGRAPLPESIDSIDVKYLLNLEWGEYNGARARVGVLSVDNNSSSNSFTASGLGGTSYGWSFDDADTVPVNGIEAIVVDVMNRTGRFRLVERNVLDSVLAEQDLVSDGRIAKPSGAKTGNVLGAQYLVQMVVTDYESKTSGTNSGIGALVTKKLPGLGELGFKKGEGRVGMNFRLIDAETSEIIYTKQVESIIRESGLTFGGAGFSSAGALGGFLGTYSKTPIGQAVIAGINKGIYELVKQIGAAPASGSVIKAEGNRVWINVGADVVSSGEMLKVMHKGEELIDPETGISLGASEMEIGQLRVAEVADKFSIADRVAGSKAINRGDKVVSTAAAVSMEYASDWNPPKRFF
ncbi:MAG: CsgG/HfaB family protein [Pseudomonadales bacterium]